MQKVLPKGWKWVRLGEVVRVDKGKKMELLDSYDEKSTPYIGIDNLRTSQYTSFTKDTTGLLCVEADLLIAWDGANAGTIGYGLRGYVGSTIARLHPSEESTTKYLGFLLKSKFQQFNVQTHGAAIPHLSKTHLLKTLIPLPPLPTQHSIVEVLEEADNLRKLRQQADEKMKDLIPSFFVQMFGNPVKNPKGWEVTRLGEACEKFTGTRNPADEEDGYFSYVDISSIDNINGTISSFRTIVNIEAPSRARKIIKTNDVLVSTVRPNLNAVAIVSSLLNNQICSTGFCVLRVYPEISNHHYIYAITRSKYFIESMTKKTQGASYPAVSDKDIFDFSIPLPPLPLQQQFAKLVENIEAEKARQAESRKKLDELFNSLMQRAFTGELVV